MWQEGHAYRTFNLIYTNMNLLSFYSALKKDCCQITFIVVIDNKQWSTFYFF